MAAIAGVKPFLSAPRIPSVSALPAHDAGDKGGVLMLASSGMLHFNDGTQWRKMGNVGRTDLPSVEESVSYGGLLLPLAALADVADPNYVQLGGMNAYTASKSTLAFADQVLRSTAVQPHVADHAYATVMAGAGNVVATVGLPPTKTGTWVSGSAHATTNTRRKSLRQNIPTAATAGSSVGLHYPSAFARVSDGTDGGFWFRAVFGFAAYTAASRFFVGVRIGTSLIVAQTPVDTGIAFTTTDLFQVTISSFLANTVDVSLARLSDGAEYPESVVTMPASTTFLAPQIWINNGANAAVSSLDLVKSHIEWRHTG